MAKVKLSENQKDKVSGGISGPPNSLDRTPVISKPSECVDCGDCKRFCAPNAITFDSNNHPVSIDEGLCTRCSKCIDECPAGVFS